MTATNHAVTGALIATAIQKPLIAVPVAFLMHFVMDAIPHFGLVHSDVFKRNSDRKFQFVLIVDVMVFAFSLILIPYLLKNYVPVWITFTCMFACMSPDLVWGWHFYHEIKHKTVRTKGWFSKFHKWIQWKEFHKGLYIELAWFIVAIYSIILIAT